MFNQTYGSFWHNTEDQLRMCLVCKIGIRIEMTMKVNHNPMWEKKNQNPNKSEFLIPIPILKSNSNTIMNRKWYKFPIPTFPDGVNPIQICFCSLNSFNQKEINRMGDE